MLIPQYKTDSIIETLKCQMHRMDESIVPDFLLLIIAKILFNLSL